MTHRLGTPAPMAEADGGWRVSIRGVRTDEMRAEFDVEVGGDPAALQDGGPLRLTGTVTGPFRGRDVTLPATVRLVESPTPQRPHGATARVVLPDPLYWTPELPNLYRLAARIHRPGDAEDAGVPVERAIGLRRLGVRGRSLWLDGRRWVVRGMGMPTADFEPNLLRSLPAAAVLADPDPGVCGAADRIGVALVARLEDVRGRPFEPAAAVERLARWDSHPSVMLAVVPRTLAASAATAIVARAREISAGMLLGLEVDGLEPPPGLAELGGQADWVLVDLPQGAVPHEAWRAWPVPRPLVARWRRPSPDGEPVDLTACRRECDRLQAALAAWGIAGGGTAVPWDWSGYVVA